MTELSRGGARTKSLATLLLALLVLSSGTSMALGSTSAQSPKPGTPYGDYALALYDSNGTVNFSQLQRLTGGRLDIPSFENAIANDYLSVGVHRVVLDIGWQNYAVGGLPFQQWVDDWLTACDLLGVQNLLMAGQLTKSGVGSVWVQSLLNADPNTRTFSSDGQPSDYVSPDNPDVAKAIESDLLLLNSYYGSHHSLAGLTTGYPSSDPYYSNSTVPDIGYSNSTLQNFASSLYYARDVNGTGFLSNGTLDKLWASFRSVEPSVVLSSGSWMSSSDFQVYGAGANRHSIGMTFRLSRNESGITLSWFGSKVGSPGQMAATLYPIANGTVVDAATGTENVSENAFSSILGWQAPIRFTGDLAAGQYWLVLTAPSGNSSSYYDVFLRDYAIPGASAAYTLPPGGGTQKGSTILWVRNSDGADASIYPFENALVNPLPEQRFVANSTYSFNTVFLFVSDREYDQTNGTLSVIDLTDNKTLAAGSLSQALTHGLQDWVPISLDANVTTTPFHTYDLVVSEPNNGYSWRVILRGVSVDPSQAGFQGQSSYWLFRLASLRWSSGHMDFTGFTSNGHDAIANGTTDAVRFFPHDNETLNSLSFSTKNLQPSGTNYAAQGSLTFEIRGSDTNGLNPAGPPLQSVSVPLSQVPQNGMVNVSGFSQQLTAGKPYWVVISSNSSQEVPLVRLTSPYRFMVKVSSDGKTWTDPSEGPSELSFQISTSAETIGNFVKDIPQLTVNQDSLVAQPIVVNDSAQVQGVYLGGAGFGVHSSLSPNSYLEVSINLDNGKDQPSSQMLAHGTYFGSNITYVSPDLVTFSSVARLQPGQRYWIVVKAVGGDYFVAPVEYTINPPGYSGNFTALRSTDGGYGWSKVSNSTTVLPYYLESPVDNLPTFSTQQLSADLAMSHSFGTDKGILRGWNAYIRSAELAMYQNVSAYFQGQTGQKWEFYVTTSRNLLNQLDRSLVEPIPTPPGAKTCSDLAAQLQRALATTKQQYVPISAESVASCGDPVRALSSQLAGTMFLGGGFGGGTATRVLLLGSNLTDSTGLSDLFNVTYVDIAANPGLSRVGPIGSYRAVVWLAGNSSDGNTLLKPLENYVRGGGLLLVFRTPPPWMRGLIGFDWTNAPAGVGSGIPGSVSAAYAAFTAHTDYNYTGLVGVGDSTFIGSYQRSTLGVNEFGMGEVVYFNPPQGGGSLNNTVSDSSIVLANVVLHSAGKGVSPVWSGSTDTTMGSLKMSVLGRLGGPVLFSTFNPTQAPLPLELELNASYFGLPGSWTLIYPKELSSVSGSGSLVKVTSTVDPASWEPIMLVPRVNMTLAYSNLQEVRSLAYPNQLLVTLTGVQRQQALAAMTSTAVVNSVSIDDQVQLSRLGSIQGLSNSSSGWFYDSANATLFVKYLSNGTSSIRVLLSSPIVVATAPPYAQLAEYLAVFLAADLTIVALIWARYRKPRKPASSMRT